MSNQIVLRSPTENRTKPLLLHNYSKSTSSSSFAEVAGAASSCFSKSTSSSSFAEVAGGTTAECAAVCCCCPFGLFNLLVLAIYKVPAGLFRKALKKKRKQQLIKKGLLPKRKKEKGKYGCDDFELQIRPVVDLQNFLNSEESERKVIELDKEMWEIFYNTGFWRSPLQ